MTRELAVLGALARAGAARGLDRAQAAAARFRRAGEPPAPAARPPRTKYLASLARRGEQGERAP